MINRSLIDLVTGDESNNSGCVVMVSVSKTVKGIGSTNLEPP